MSNWKLQISRKLLSAVLLLATGAPSFAADPSQDPGGWRQFKWGMSFQDANALANGQLSVDARTYPEDTRTYYDYFATFGASMPDGTPIVVLLQFGCAQRGLEGVSLNFERNAKKPNVSGQYGPPDHIQADGSFEWRFPTTTIVAGINDTKPGNPPEIDYDVAGAEKDIMSASCPAKPLQDLGY